MLSCQLVERFQNVLGLFRSHISQGKMLLVDGSFTTIAMTRFRSPVRVNFGDTATAHNTFTTNKHQEILESKNVASLWAYTWKVSESSFRNLFLWRNTHYFRNKVSETNFLASFTKETIISINFLKFSAVLIHLQQKKTFRNFISEMNVRKLFQVCAKLYSQVITEIHWHCN